MNNTPINVNRKATEQFNNYIILIMVHNFTVSIKIKKNDQNVPE